MQLKDFKLEGQDEDSYSLAHPSGRKFKLLKKGLSAKSHEVIKGIQHFDDGGTPTAIPDLPAYVQPVEVPDSNPTAAPIPVPNAMPTSNAGPAPASMPEEPVAPAPQAAPVVAAPPPVNPFVATATANENLINAEQQDVRDFTKSMQGVAAGQGAAAKEYSDKLAGLQTPQEIVNSYKQKDDALTQAIASGQIDPERYWNNKSTGSKITAGLGLLLSGMGSGATGQTNLAYDHIKDSINKDIEAQKADQSKNMNLWKMNRAAMNTDLEATLATQNQAYSAAQAKAMIQTANSNSAAGKLRGQQAISELEKEKIQNRSKLALLTGTQNGNQGVDPSAYIGALVDPKEQDAAYKDLDTVTKYNGRAGNITNLFDQADKENTMMKTGGGMLRTPPSVIALNSEFDALAKDREGRVNEQVLKDLKANAPQPGDLASTVQEKKGNLIKMLKEGSGSALLDRYRVPYQKAPIDETQVFLNWARANPNNPKAQLVLKKLGVQ